MCNIGGGSPVEMSRFHRHCIHLEFNALVARRPTFASMVDTKYCRSRYVVRVDQISGTFIVVIHCEAEATP